MSSKFTLYALDTETTGLDPVRNEIIEISFLRLADEAQQTWFLKPTNRDSVEQSALRVNGHKMEDLFHETKFGRETYQEASKVVAQIENWMMEDMNTPENRILVGQNPTFDIAFLQNLWQRCNSAETFPFGHRPFVLDTRQIALFLDLATGTESQYYNLGSLVEKYGVKKERAHQAASDTRMCKNVFMKQVQFVKDLVEKTK